LNDKKLSVDQIKEKLFKDIFGFTRMRGDLKARINGILEHVITHQKTFDYRYYLNKSCPMPAAWKERRAQLLLEAAQSPEARGKAYKELFETANTPKEAVADFLTEFVA